MSFREDEELELNEIVVDGEIWAVETLKPEDNYICERECDTLEGKHTPAAFEVSLVSGESTLYLCFCAIHFEEWSGTKAKDWLC